MPWLLTPLDLPALLASVSLDTAAATSLVPALASLAVALVVLRRDDLPGRLPMLGLCSALALWHASDFGLAVWHARSLRISSAIASAALVPFLVHFLGVAVGKPFSAWQRALYAATALFALGTATAFFVGASRRFVHSPAWAALHLVLFLPPMVWSIGTVARTARTASGPLRARAMGIAAGAVLGVVGGLTDLASMAWRGFPALGGIGTSAGVLALAWSMDAGADSVRALPTRSALLAVTITSCAALLALTLPEVAALPPGAVAVGGAGIALLGLVAFRLGASRLEREALRMRSLALLGTFAAELAHEVRNPLAAIRGEVQRLAGDIPEGAPADLAESLLRIDHEVDRLDQVVGDYGALARAKSVKNEKLDLSLEVRELLALHRRAVPAGIELREELAGDLPRLRGDGDRLRGAILNLVRNAIAAMPSGGTLIVRTACRQASTGAQIVVEVADTGVGIGPRDIARIFEPLFTTRERGTGLGLSISRRIAEEHGGTIEVASEKGRGSTFRVVLPVQN